MTTALITGASSGIGLELARLFAVDKHDVVLVARRGEKLRELADELQPRYGVRAVVLPADLSLPNAPQEIFDWLQADGVTIDFLVNNAGFGEFGLFTETDWQREGASIQVNVLALTHLTKLFLPGMIARRSGKILNVASLAAFQPGPLMAVYFATKAYVLSLSEALANELQGTGVTITALCPGPTHSGFQDAAGMHDAGLFARKGLPDSAEVARYGYHAMHKGRTVAVHGALNQVLATGNRFIPRKLAAAIARKMSERVRK